jgi:hypothetical protein
MNLEFADPATGATQVFAAAPPKQSFTEATWSNNSETVAFVHFASSSLGDVPGRGINLKSQAGGPEATLLPASAPGVEHWISPFQPSWAPTQKSEIAYWEQAQSSDPPYYADTLKVATLPGLTTRTLAGPFNPIGPLSGVGLDAPAWSADGKRIAFTRGQTGIYSLPATGGPLVQLVSGGPGYIVESPSYAPNGKDLAYVKYFESQGQVTLWQLVVRDLRNGQDRVIASGQQSLVSHGPQSWSPDSTQIAFTEWGRTSAVNIVRRDGTGRRVLLERGGLDAPAWGHKQLPSYYIKDVEVAQAIAPELEPIKDLEPLREGPKKLTWKLPSKNGYTMPLLAGKPTLVRIYVGDASLAPGESAARTLSYRVETSTMAGPLEEERPTLVTANDVEPNQKIRSSSLNVVLPAGAAHSGTPVQIKVEINLDQGETECGGCYPNGNSAQVNGVQFERGGTLIVVPVPIVIVDPSTTPPKRYPPPAAYPETLVPGMNQLVPAADARIILAAQPFSFEWPIASPSATEQQQLLNSLAMRGKLQTLRAAYLASGAVPGGGAPGVTRWIGYAGPPSGGLSVGVGDVMLLTPLQPSAAKAVHELGHTLGLNHKIGKASTPIAGATKLPYDGIGGIGYRLTEEGVGDIDAVLDSSTTSDVMTYDPRRWTSPLTWEQMFTAIHSGSEVPLLRRTGSAREVEAGIPVARAAATVRLVSGAVTKSTAVIFDSMVVKAVAPRSPGPSAGRIVALDSAGRTIGAALVRGRPLVARNGASALPFVVALPANASIASLEVQGPTGDVLAERHRSSTRPTGHFVELPTQTQAKHPLNVRWVATDADGNRLSVIVFARRGDKPWRPIALGRARSSCVVRPRSLGSSGALQLRLLINDRFRTVNIDSAPIQLT